MANLHTEGPVAKRKQSFTIPKASELMSAPVRTVTADVTLDSVRHALLDAAISGMPVVDEDGRAVGLLSKTDLLRASEEGPELEELVEGADMSQRLGYAARIVRLGAQTVGDIMTRGVVTVSRNATALEVARLMAETRVHRVVVLDPAGKVCGVISSLDVLDWIGHA